MLEICGIFAMINYITYNSEKSICIKYGSLYIDEKAILNKTELKWSNKVRHLGHYFDTELKENTNCCIKIGNFIVSVNSLFSNLIIFNLVFYQTCQKHIAVHFMIPSYGNVSPNIF